MRQVSVLSLLSLVSLSPSTGRGECRWPVTIIPGVREYTNDFYFSASSAEGAPGEVVGVELSLTIERSHGNGLYGAALVGGYDARVAELRGEPVYSEEFWEFGFSPSFFEVEGTESLRGFIIAWPTKVLDDPYPNRFFGVPIRVGTVYFRLRGVPGDGFEVSFLDDVLAGPLNQCLQSQLSYYEKLTVYSSRHVPGSVRVVDREPIRTGPPPLPPDAKVYDKPPDGETAGARFELSGGTTTPGQIVPVDFFITSNYEFIGYLTGGRFPTDYLELRRVEVVTTPGVHLIDNESGEFGIYSTNSRRRMGAEGERVHVARLYFKVKEAARDANEVTVTLQDLTRVYGENVIASAAYVNRIRILRVDPAGGIVPVAVEVSPIVIAQGVISLQSPTRTTVGDANLDGGFDISDPISVFTYLFLDRSQPLCLPAANYNGDVPVDISDPIAMLVTLFDGAPMPEPKEVPCD